MSLRLLPLLIVAAAACSSESASVPTPSTAGDRVEISAPLTMSDLGRERQLRVYLPPGYYESDRRYPVIYLHDGQNLYDDATAYAGEWGIDETLDELAREGIELIAVGIDNGGERRMTELNPWSNSEYGEGEGDAYLEFLVGKAKLYVDSHYRTLPGREHTLIMGSSMGGFISHYAMLEYRDRFSGAGIFSPSYWVAEEIWDATRTAPPDRDDRLYLLVGGREGSDMVANTQRMGSLLAEIGHPEENLSVTVMADGEHNEAFWRREFAAAVRWLVTENSLELR